MRLDSPVVPVRVNSGIARSSENIEWDASLVKGKEPSHVDVISGVDIGKNSLSVVGGDDQGAVILRQAMRRQTFIDFVKKLPRCVTGMKACCGAHHLGWLFAAGGHEVTLMSAETAGPYVKPKKNDDRDAEAIKA